MTDTQAPGAQPIPPVAPHPVYVVGPVATRSIEGPTTPAAEPGQTTTEWKTLIAGAATAGLLLGVTLLSNHAHWLTQSDIDAIKNFGNAAIAVGVAYILSRGIRKAGTGPN